jgi:hypothetical protein
MKCEQHAVLNTLTSCHPSSPSPQTQPTPCFTFTEDSVLPSQLTFTCHLNMSVLAVQLSQRSASPGALDAETVRWQCVPPPSSNLFLEYIPGRDVLYSQEQLAAGDIWVCAKRTSEVPRLTL